jgi:hypothetical protein
MSKIASICPLETPGNHWNWGFFRRRSGFFREADHQFCDSDQESERSDAGELIVAEVIGIVKPTA